MRYSKQTTIPILIALLIISIQMQDVFAQMGPAPHAARRQKQRNKIYDAPESIDAWCDNEEEKEYWLLVPIVTVQYVLNRTDATNIYPDGQVSYRGSVGDGAMFLRQTQSQDAKEFAQSVRASDTDKNSRVRFLDRGAKIKIRSIRPDKEQVKVIFSEMGGSVYGIYLKLEEDYTLEDCLTSFQFAFTDNEADLGSRVIELSLGMSIEEVIDRKGAPITQINLGPKVILTYGDIKLIFLDNQLSDAQ